MSPPEFRARGLSKMYPRREAPALVDASLTIAPRSSVALAGRTGSGKTTLALCLAGFEAPSGGEIWRNDRRVWPGRLGPRREVQLVRQDSPLALNPGWPASELIGEPLRFQPGLERARRAMRVRELAEAVALPAHCLDLRPGELSGGQRQRVAVARALAVENMELLILDEPVRGLDPASVEELLALFVSLQKERGFSLLYISHDLDRVRSIAEDVAVIHRGAIVEVAACASFFAGPSHPESRALIEAML